VKSREVEVVVIFRITFAVLDDCGSPSDSICKETALLGYSPFELQFQLR